MVDIKLFLLDMGFFYPYLRVATRIEGHSRVLLVVQVFLVESTVLLLHYLFLAYTLAQQSQLASFSKISNNFVYNRRSQRRRFEIFR